MESSSAGTPCGRRSPRYLQRYVPADSVVLDIGAGEGYLLASLEARERWAVDLRPPWEPLASSIRFVQGSGLEPGDALPPGRSTGCS